MESDIVEIYVNKETKEVLHFIPAAGMLDNGEDLPEDAIFITQINLDHVIIDSEETKPIMICPIADDCLEKDFCKHAVEHEALDDCQGWCGPDKVTCLTAEFEPLPDSD